jgi:hypothetical protein
MDGIVGGPVIEDHAVSGDNVSGAVPSLSVVYEDRLIFWVLENL